VRDTVAARIRALPLARRRCRRRVFSWTRTVPILGRVTWRRSGSARIAPVVKVIRSRSRPFLLNRGKPMRLPSRFPARDFCQFQ
jgi:hypothetical protein